MPIKIGRQNYLIPGARILATGDCDEPQDCCLDSATPPTVTCDGTPVAFPSSLYVTLTAEGIYATPLRTVLIEYQGSQQACAPDPTTYAVYYVPFVQGFPPGSYLVKLYETSGGVYTYIMSQDRPAPGIRITTVPETLCTTPFVGPCYEPAISNAGYLCGSASDPTAVPAIMEQYFGRMQIPCTDVFLVNCCFGSTASNTIWTPGYELCTDLAKNLGAGTYSWWLELYRNLLVYVDTNAAGPTYPCGKIQVKLLTHIMRRVSADLDDGQQYIAVPEYLGTVTNIIDTVAFTSANMAAMTFDFGQIASSAPACVSCGSPPFVTNALSAVVTA